MLRSLALLVALADGGPAPVAVRALRVENLGAAAVTLQLRRADGTVPWGPFELAAHEVVGVSYCPCAQLTLELRAARRAKALVYPLKDQTALLLSEDRWSEGDPIVRHATDEAACGERTTCAGPEFHIGR